ncbi:MAG: tetratricopeptide repeat protein [Microcoleaceae cyanobacterium]
MVDKRRGFVGVVLILSLVAFVGFSMGPIIGGIIGENQASQPSTPTSEQSAQTQRINDLKAQARGYELVLQREPQNQTALQGFLQAQLELISVGEGEVNTLIEPLETLSELNPQTTEYSILLAQSQQYAGDSEAAAQTYRSIIEQQPGQIQALQGWVSLLLDQDQPQAAIGILEETLKAAPEANQAQPGTIDQVSVQLILGQVYARQERYDEAIAIYDEAINTDETDFRPVLAKAIILKEQGQEEEAEQFFATAVELAPPSYKDQIQRQADGASTPVETTPAPETLEALPSEE